MHAPGDGERLTLAITTLLVTVAVQWTASSMVPMIGSWTLISKFSVACLILQFC